MAFIKVEKVTIRGISGCVPANIEENISLPFYATKEEAEKVVETTGIVRRHVAKPGTTASDLCYKAAEKLIEALGWEKETIDLIAFCTQNPDYKTHPTSFVVHDKLGLSESCMCLDFFHGCPGWVVSLSTVTQLMSGGCIKRAILLDGDTASVDQDADNREERPLFGDAGTVTALEFDEKASPMFFNIGTKSDDGKALIREIGGYRNPYTLETLKIELDKHAGVPTECEATHKMDSMDVFSFAITMVPKAIKKLCAEYSVEAQNVDLLVLHQANKLIIENIAKRMKVSMDKVPLSLTNYGNTTSASIPLTLASQCSKNISKGGTKVLACAFGTGLAWGAVYMELNNVVCPQIQEI